MVMQRLFLKKCILLYLSLDVSVPMLFEWVFIAMLQPVKRKADAEKGKAKKKKEDTDEVGDHYCHHSPRFNGKRLHTALPDSHDIQDHSFKPIICVQEMNPAWKAYMDEVRKHENSTCRCLLDDIPSTVTDATIVDRTAASALSSECMMCEWTRNIKFRQCFHDWFCRVRTCCYYTEGTKHAQPEHQRTVQRDVIMK